MKTLSVDEASSNLARSLQLALANEEIGIRTGGAIVALRPAGLGTVSKPNLRPAKPCARSNATPGSPFPRRSEGAGLGSGLSFAICRSA